MAKATHFQGRAIPRVGKPLILSTFVCYSSPSFLVIWKFDVILAKIFLAAVRTLAMEPFGPYGQNDLFSRSKDPRSSSPSILVIQNFDTLAMESVSPDGQSGPFSRSNEPRSKIRRLFYQNFSWMCIKTIAMEPVGPDGLNDPFSSLPSFFVIVNYDVIFAKKFHGRPLDLSYKVMYGLLVIQNSEVILAEICHGRSLRH
ncbi:hypothetical protein H5410_053006 [Solanum commersonii]|uniref:Uncharacterized protein n=1 Tax=Solanum commersonii TaxID=4109 RepID=A0A9J5X2M8_SOLCO|nr:hypothetical protein H5410_053006 [Solanum commersonii]